MNVQSHPDRPELPLLRDHLKRLEYTEHARERVVSYAACEGTLAGCPELDPSDEAAAERVFVDGMETVSPTDPEWDDPAVTLDLDGMTDHDAAVDLGPIRGGAPDPDPAGWPRTKSAADRRADRAEIREWYRQHPEG